MDKLIPSAPTDWPCFEVDLNGIPCITDPAAVRRKSRDFFYSLILKAQCARWRVPLTVRGGGTGNYGQAVPLEGGVVLDMTALDRIIALEDGLLTVEPGRKMGDIDAATRPQGWKLRMHPSTKRTATIGGFIAGGSGGVGSITWGGLRDAGNIVGARRVVRGGATRRDPHRRRGGRGVNHAYGTTGIITALTLAMVPAQP